MIPTPDPRRLGIELVAIGPLDTALFDTLGPELEVRFHTAVTRATPLPIDPEWFDRDRGQYCAGPILDALIDTRSVPARTLGVIDADIFAPNLNFIFGQAVVAGCCALIGLARLRPEFYDEAPNPELFARRILIEAVHELGHSTGLEHCPDQSCVMNFSHQIQDSDRKGPDFCARCLPFIR